MPAGCLFVTTRFVSKSQFGHLHMTSCASPMPTPIWPCVALLRQPVSTVHSAFTAFTTPSLSMPIFACTWLPRRVSKQHICSVFVW